LKNPQIKNLFYLGIKNNKKIVDPHLNKNNTSKRVANFFKFLLFFFLLSTPLFAAVDGGDSILLLVNSGIQSWIPSVKKASLWVFLILTLVNWVWSFGLMALSGFELNEFIATLIKKIMYVGVFLFLFNVDYWLNILMNGFSQLSTNVSGGVTVTPNNIITSAFVAVKNILSSLDMDIALSLFKIIAGLIILIAFVFMAIDLLVVYVKFYLMGVIIYFALALSGLEHFKQIGLNPVVTAVKVGVELFLIQSVMALSITSIQSTFSEVTKNATIDLVLQILVMSLIFAVITKLVPTVIEAVFQGTIGDSSGAASGFKAVAAMMGGMAAGVVAGSIGTSRAIQAAKALDVAEGGSGSLSGIAKNLMNTGGEHLKENFTKGRMPNDVANRLQEKVKNLGTTTGNISGGSTTQSEPYQSGVGV
jgi:type IV secretion system protein TrbL